MAELKPINFDYMGGINMSRSRTNYPKEEAYKVLNMRLSNGTATRRYGPSKFHADQMAGGGAVLGLFDFKYGSSGQKFTEVENTVMYTDDGTTRTSIKTGLTAGYYGIFESFDDFMWWVNGIDTPLKYDGTTVTNASIATPAVGTFAAATGDPGVLTGTYYYLVTFYVTATGQESQPFTLADAPSVSPSSDKVDLSNIPVSSDSQVTARRIYRTTAGGSVYNARLLTTISDNSTTTYEDNTADSSLGDLIELNHDPMPSTITKIVKHNDRFFGFIENSSRLYVSRQFNAWYWPQGLIDLSTDQEVFYIDIDPKDGDKITNIISYYDYLVVFKYNSIHVIEGYDFYQLSRRKILGAKGIGCVGKRAAAVAQDGWLYFIDINGLNRTNAQIVQYRDFGDRMEGFFDINNVNTDVVINGSYVSNCIVHIDNTRPNNHVLFYIPTGTSAYNDKQLVFNYVEQVWEYDTGFKTQSIATREVSGKDVLIRGDDYGYVWTCDQLNGDGATINSTATGGNANGLVDTAQSMTVDAYKGCYIEILSGTGEGQRRLITNNTETCFATTEGFSVVPSTDSIYTVGGIDGQYFGPYHHYGNSAYTKNLSHVIPKISSNGNYGITMNILYDFQNENTAFETQTLSASSNSVWDTGLYDIARWDNPTLLMNTLYTAPDNLHRYSLVGFKHKKAGQGFTVYGYDKLYSIMGFGIS